MPRKCDWCDDTPIYISVNNIGRLCKYCYDVWWEEEVLPELRREQEEWEELRDQMRIGSLRQCDDSLLHLSRSERRRIVDVQLPDWPEDASTITAGSVTDLRPASETVRPVQDQGREEGRSPVVDPDLAEA